MKTVKFSEKLALAAGTVSLAAGPLTAEAAIINGTGGPLSISQTDADGTIVNWDVDSDGNNEFQLRLSKFNFGGGNFSDQIFLESVTTGSANLNGRGLVGPSPNSAEFFALNNSFNVGPTLASGYAWGSAPLRGRDVIFSYVYSVFASAGFDEFVNGAEGTNFIGFRFDSGAGLQYGWAQFDIDLTPGALSATIEKWVYSDTPGEGVHVGTAGGGEPPSPVSEPATILPTIALLGLGAMGVRRWREQRKAAA